MKSPDTKWKDEYGNIWTLISDFYGLRLYNEELGYGLWKGGEGLEQVEENHNENKDAPQT